MLILSKISHLSKSFKQNNFQILEKVDELNKGII